MKIPKDIKVGSIHKTKSHGNLKVIRYINSRKIKVRFYSTGYETVTDSRQIRRGEVRDRLSRTVHGVGFLGDGEFKVATGKVTTEAYNYWSEMIRRCYDQSYVERFPSYKGCTVCEDWHNFQKFAKWHKNNHPNDGNKYHLDKDIKVSGNKTYSPETCLFVLAQENIEKAHAKKYKFKNKDGEVFEIYNLNKFCKENGLTSSGMYAVNSGKYKEHKGWRLA